MLAACAGPAGTTTVTQLYEVAMANPSTTAAETTTGPGARSASTRRPSRGGVY